MPAIWSSSERPLSVRTVWVDGIRHAILSPDDPLVDPKLRRRSRSSRNRSYSAEYRQIGSELDRLNSCFSNLHVVVGNNKSENRASRVYRKLSAPPCTRLSSTPNGNVDSLEDDKTVEKDHRTGKQNIEVRVNRPIFKDEIYGRKTPESERNSSSNRTERRRTERTFDAFWNPLFERVLQWLDLSGRAQSCELEEDFAVSSPRDEDRKWRLVRRRGSRFKRESFAEKERIVIQNYKLRREGGAECVGTEENRMLKRRLPKIKFEREEVRDSDEATSDLLFCVSSANESLKSEEEESKEEVRTRERISATWSPPRRLQLHVVMPNLVCKETTSSQESLIND